MCTVSEFTYPSSGGGSTIFAREWRPEGAPAAVLQLAHGICEHCGRYDDFARFLARNGVLVVANDHLGHGKTAATPEERGFFAETDGWRRVVDDMEALRAKTAGERPGLPYFLLGHSMGSFLARTYLILYPGRVTGAILSGTGQQGAPLVAAGRALTALFKAAKGSHYQSALINSMAFGTYNRHFEPRRTDSDWLTRDEKIIDEHLKDELCNFIPGVGLYHDMMGGIRFISALKNVRRMDVRTPVLFFSGSMDPVGEETRGVMRAVNNFNRAGCRDVTVKIYPDGRHEMLNELNRAEVYANVLAWLRSKLPQE